MITAHNPPQRKPTHRRTAKRRLDAQNVVATYAYDGLNRRITKVVTNSGEGIVPRSDDLDRNGTADADGLLAGNKSDHYYYAGWRVIEETDNAGTPKTLAQTVYGTEYIDEPVCRDRNTDTTIGGSPDSDCLDSGGSARSFYHQDANYRAVALTDESAAVIERYEYDAYGEPRVDAGGTGVQTLGARDSDQVFATLRLRSENSGASFTHVPRMPSDVPNADNPVRFNSAAVWPTSGKPSSFGVSFSQLRKSLPHSLASTLSIARRASTGYQKLSW